LLSALASPIALPDNRNNCSEISRVPQRFPVMALLVLVARQVALDKAAESLVHRPRRTRSTARRRWRSASASGRA
jgi:hypothetical protein